MKLYVKEGDTDVKVLPDGDDPPAGYEEKTSIEDWAGYAPRAISIYTFSFRDKLTLRGILRVLIYTKMQVATPADAEDPAKWNLLNGAEKAIAAHYFLVGKEDFLLEVVDNDLYWTLEATTYREWSQEDRKSRLAIMEAIVFRRLLYVQEAKEVLVNMNQLLKGTKILLDGNDETMGKITVNKLNQEYVEGVEGTQKDNVGSFVFVGIRDYIDSVSGTPFATPDGFRDLTYTFRTGHTADTVADELLRVLDGTW